MLKTEFENIGLPLTDAQAAEFEIFYDLLITENRKYNLTAITEQSDVVKKHFIDSVILLKEVELKQDAAVIDIGCGAGFPSVPIKILREDLNLTLVDSVNKKVNFVNIVIESLGLKNVRAIHARAEDLTKSSLQNGTQIYGKRITDHMCNTNSSEKNNNDIKNISGTENVAALANVTASKRTLRESFDYVLSRAVAPLNVLAEWGLPFLKTGGLMIAYKSVKAQEEIMQAEKVIKLLGGEIERVITKNIYDSERKFVVIKKVFPTPAAYPRKGNKIKK